MKKYPLLGGAVVVVLAVALIAGLGGNPVALAGADQAYPSAKPTAEAQEANEGETRDLEEGRSSLAELWEMREVLYLPYPFEVIPLSCDEIPEGLSVVFREPCGRVVDYMIVARVADPAIPVLTEAQKEKAIALVKADGWLRPRLNQGAQIAEVKAQPRFKMSEKLEDGTITSSLVDVRAVVSLEHPERPGWTPPEVRPTILVDLEKGRIIDRRTSTSPCWLPPEAREAGAARPTLAERWDMRDIFKWCVPFEIIPLRGEIPEGLSVVFREPCGRLVEYMMVGRRMEDPIPRLEEKRAKAIAIAKDYGWVEVWLNRGAQIAEVEVRPRFMMSEKLEDGTITSSLVGFDAMVWLKNLPGWPAEKRAALVRIDLDNEMVVGLSTFPLRQAIEPVEDLDILGAYPISGWLDVPMFAEKTPFWGRAGDTGFISVSWTPTCQKVAAGIRNMRTNRLYMQRRREGNILVTWHIFRSDPFVPRVHNWGPTYPIDYTGVVDHP